jgi:hypothetical protein
MRSALLCGLSACAIVIVCTPATAQSQPPQTEQAGNFAQFVPQDDTISTRLDFTYWNTALRWFVLRMGRSLREYEPRPDTQLGTRFSYGHDSAYRLEGNRVAFSLLPPDVIQSLTDYRRDLEQLAATVPIARLSRNEQLAYWMNLHNVAVIEQIALAYPVKKPSLIPVGDSGLPLDESPFITVAGVKLSPKDIRTRIVYPNWRDPKVIYGFWRGDIGGPSISREAFASDNVGAQLDFLALEFVNSLRGTQKSGNTMLVSSIYDEARPFFFPNWPADLRAHIAKHAEEDVAAILASTSAVDASVSETDIADLSKGEREPQLTNLVKGDQYQSTSVDPAIARLLAERKDKIDRAVRQNERQGKVTVQGGEANPPPPPEIVR